MICFELDVNAINTEDPTSFWGMQMQQKIQRNLVWIPIFAKSVQITKITETLVNILVCSCVFDIQNQIMVFVSTYIV